MTTATGRFPLGRSLRAAHQRLQRSLPVRLLLGIPAYRNRRDERDKEVAMPAAHQAEVPRPERQSAGAGNSKALRTPLPLRASAPHRQRRMDGRRSPSVATAILKGDARKNPHETDRSQRPASAFLRTTRCLPPPNMRSGNGTRYRASSPRQPINSTTTRSSASNRYISLTRRRLTIGSHSGAEAAALYHSLAITCHRCSVNVFDYFCDIIDRCAEWPPNTPIEKYRDLLPDRWRPSQK